MPKRRFSLKNDSQRGKDRCLNGLVLAHLPLQFGHTPFNVIAAARCNYGVRVWVFRRLGNVNERGASNYAPSNVHVRLLGRSH